MIELRVPEEMTIKVDKWAEKHGTRRVPKLYAG